MRRGRRALDWLIVGASIGGAWRRLNRTSVTIGRRDEGAWTAWLEFEVDGEATGSTIRQTATFDPVGLLGLLYWYAMYPLHSVVFAGMLRGIVQAVEGQNCAPARYGTR